jgi:hypothetical protein
MLAGPTVPKLPLLRGIAWTSRCTWVCEMSATTGGTAARLPTTEPCMDPDSVLVQDPE